MEPTEVPVSNDNIPFPEETSTNYNNINMESTEIPFSNNNIQFPEETTNSNNININMEPTEIPFSNNNIPFPEETSTNYNTININMEPADVPVPIENIQFPEETSTNYNNINITVGSNKDQIENKNNNHSDSDSNEKDTKNIPILNQNQINESDQNNINIESGEELGRLSDNGSDMSMSEYYLKLDKAYNALYPEQNIRLFPENVYKDFTSTGVVIDETSSEEDNFKFNDDYRAYAHTTKGLNKLMKFAMYKGKLLLEGMKQDMKDYLCQKKICLAKQKLYRKYVVLNNMSEKKKCYQQITDIIKKMNDFKTNYNENKKELSEMMNYILTFKDSHEDKIDDVIAEIDVVKENLQSECGSCCEDSCENMFHETYLTGKDRRYSNNFNDYASNDSDCFKRECDDVTTQKNTNENSGYNTKSRLPFKKMCNYNTSYEDMELKNFRSSHVIIHQDIYLKPNRKPMQPKNEKVPKEVRPQIKKKGKSNIGKSKNEKSKNKTENVSGKRRIPILKSLIIEAIRQKKEAYGDKKEIRKQFKKKQEIYEKNPTLDAYLEIDDFEKKYENELKNYKNIINGINNNIYKFRKELNKFKESSPKDTRKAFDDIKKFASTQQSDCDSGCDEPCNNCFHSIQVTNIFEKKNNKEEQNKKPLGQKKGDSLKLKRNDSFELKREDVVQINKEDISELKREDTFELKREDTFERKIEESYDIKIEDSFELKREDTFELKKEDTFEIKGEDSFEIKGEDSFELKKEDTFEIKGEDSFELKKEDTIELKREDTFELKREDTFELKKEDTLELKREDAIKINTDISELETEEFSENKEVYTINKKKRRAQNEEPFNVKESKTLNTEEMENVSLNKNIQTKSPFMSGFTYVSQNTYPEEIYSSRFNNNYQIHNTLTNNITFNNNFIGNNEPHGNSNVYGIYLIKEENKSFFTYDIDYENRRNKFPQVPKVMEVNESSHNDSIFLNMQKVNEFNSTVDLEELYRLKQIEEEAFRVKQLEELNRMKQIEEEAFKVKQLEELILVKQIEEALKVKQMDELNRIKQIEEALKVKQMDELNRMKQIEEEAFKIKQIDELKRMKQIEKILEEKQLEALNTVKQSIEVPITKIVDDKIEEKSEKETIEVKSKEETDKVKLVEVSNLEQEKESTEVITKKKVTEEEEKENIADVKLVEDNTNIANVKDLIQSNLTGTCDIIRPSKSHSETDIENESETQSINNENVIGEMNSEHTEDVNDICNEKKVDNKCEHSSTNKRKSICFERTGGAFKIRKLENETEEEDKSDKSDKSNKSDKTDKSDETDEEDEEDKNKNSAILVETITAVEIDIPTDVEKDQKTLLDELKCIKEFIQIPITVMDVSLKTNNTKTKKQKVKKSGYKIMTRNKMKMLNAQKKKSNKPKTDINNKTNTISCSDKKEKEEVLPSKKSKISQAKKDKRREKKKAKRKAKYINEKLKSIKRRALKKKPYHVMTRSKCAKLGNLEMSIKGSNLTLY